MDFSQFKAITIPEGSVKRIISGGVTLWEKGYTNLVPLSIAADGSVYNGTGYKNGYRIRSGGAEATGNGVSCTGFIPCKAGDVLRFCFGNGATLWTDFSTYHTSLNFSDGAFENLGQFTSQPAHYGIFESANAYLEVTGNGDVWEYTVPKNGDIQYVRFTVPYDPTTGRNGGADLIVTVNEEIT